MGESTFIFRRRLYAAALFLLMTSAVQITAETRTFDVEAGDARTTLRNFARQAKVSVVMDRRDVQGVQTNEVSGLLVPKHALERILEGTPLVFNEDMETGAFAVTRSEIPVADLTTENPELKPIEETEMKLKKKNNLVGNFLAGVLVALMASTESSAQEDNELKVYELSPFRVDESSDIGYMATQSLAGSRLNSNLGDLGSAISVVTTEFLEDTASDNILDVLVYQMNTEVGGIGGNFAGGNTTFNNVVQNSGTTTRIRGLGEADLARNYFLTDIPFDSYNTSRIEIQRGPNAILFGLGKPAGLINNTLNEASFSDFGEVYLKFDSFGSRRTSLKFNKEIVKGKVALLVAVLNKDDEFQQDPAFDREERYYASFKWNLSESTTLSTNFETGENDANRPRPGPPMDFISLWYDYGRPIWDQSDSNRLPPPAGRNSGLHGTTADFLFGPGDYFFDPKSGESVLGGQGLLNGATTAGAGALLSGSFLPLDTLAGRYGFRGPLLPGVPPFGDDRAFYIQPALLDDRIFNFREILLEGPNSSQKAEFDAFNISLEQQFIDGKAGFELAFDKQNYDASNTSAFGGVRNYALHLDFNRELLDGRPNPNFGGVTNFSRNQGNTRQVDREAHRATAYYDLDFEDVLGSNTLTRIFGNTVFTGLFSNQEIFGEEINYSDTSDPIVAELQPSMRTNPNLRNSSIYRAYPVSGLPSGSTLVDLASKDDLRNINIGGISAVQNHPLVGTYNYWNQNTQQFEITDIPIYSQFHRPEFAVTSALRDLTEIESLAFIAQSFFLDDSLVTTVGWRQDEVTQFNPGAAPPNPDFGNNRRAILDPTFNLPTTPTLESKEDVWSYGGVYHIPDNWTQILPFGSGLSLHYSDSSNFIPTGRRVDAYNNEISAPSGETEEMGFTISLFEKKLFLKVNWYETSQLNNDGFGPQVLSITSRALRQGLESINDPVNDGLEISDMPIPPVEFQEVMGFAYDFDNLTATDNPNNQLSGTNDLSAEGVEFELFYNPSPNLSFILNVGKQQASRTNTSPAVERFMDEFIFPEIMNSPISELVITSIPNAPVMSELIQQNAINPFRLRKFSDGGPVTELKKWQASLIGNYEFKEGRLDGFGVGGAIRWKDKSSIGFPVVYNSEFDEFIQDVTNPYYGPTDTKVDFWVSYKTKLTNKIDWRIQLNIRNLLDDDDLIPLGTQPDGTIARVYLPEPIKFELSSRFSF